MPIDPTAIKAIAILDEPVRRALYEWVASRVDAVGRDEAATGVGISRALAAFHLDRMVRDGLLVPEYRRLTGRTGPGAGRPAKLYRRAPGTIAVSLPTRDYAQAAHILAETVERSSGELPSAAARGAAHDAGLAIGNAARQAAGTRPDRRRRLAALMRALDARGYEPRAGERGEIVLGNCPFDALVEEHRPLVCGMNLALAEGVLEGLGERRLRAELDQQPGQCCVSFREGTAGSGAATRGRRRPAA
jgi:predicted ArsR family transcriptional regulator